ncbi:MAG: polyphosphate:AMP phosphotransferase [Myxococcales bacterium]|nr:polyphosphate:AMP phosphotransferase [Myxococcales bacterium]
MFEAAELGRKVDKATYKAMTPQLRTELLQLQMELKETPLFPVLMIFAGVDGAGKSESINLLHSWIDPRGLITRAYDEPSDEERDRPRFWRYWRDLPPRGKIGLYLSAWYSRPILDRVYSRFDRGDFDHELERIAQFEEALADDGALILKFWMHLGKKAQKRRLKALEKDALLGWRVTERDWKHYAMYDDFVRVAERAIMRTSTHKAPWKIVEGNDERYRELTVLTTLRDAVARQLDSARARAAEKERRKAELAAELAVHTPAAPAPADPEPAAAIEVVTSDTDAGTLLDQRTVLQSLDMTRSLTKEEYNRSLKRAQAELHVLYRQAKEEGRSVALVFEGWDAAGKGGAIRRVTSALDARDYQVIPIAAPTDEEKARHYLWRFWRHLSRAGRVTIFDRSWYGRVLVERVEGFAREQEWRRAYAELCQFEEQLVDFGIILAKYWLHITPEEQLARFKAREQTPFKRWKLTEEDWRNRDRWEPYEQAVNEMVERTSTLVAPWTLVEANDKRYARVKVIEALCDRMRSSLALDGAELAPKDSLHSAAIVHSPPKTTKIKAKSKRKGNGKSNGKRKHKGKHAKGKGNGKSKATQPSA